MATVFAKSNGNWTDTTLWAFWNESTQQIEDYGQIPQSDDVVYCNGFEIIILGTITAKIITNELNQYTNISGGHIRAGAGYTVNADLVAYGEQIYYTLSNSTLSTIINGNIIIKGNTVVFGVNTNAQGRHFTINGNIINEGCNLLYSVFSVGTRAGNLTINGNVIIPNMQLRDAYTYTGNYSIFINGDLECECIMGIGNTAHINTTVSGTTIVNNIDTSLITTNKIHYRNSFNLILANITPIDTATFECKYIGSLPNPNPYIIQNPVTIAQTYPTEDKVLAPTQYGAQMELVGQYTPDYPPESVVLKDYEYGDSDDRKTGTMVQEVNVEVGCVTKEDVRDGVPLIGMYEDGQQVVGTIVIPVEEDVREGVHYDNNKVGTLIVQGGGDRLRIADFGYYTNAQSDTYIVDLTEQDKPKFAVAEERVLIEMFPDLDLDNIPDKYFDDLFVKYLKYRLIVEYYRTAGINSTFTPSEPTTEIVNYQNVRNEVWLNSANIYLKAWAKKYPESIVKPQRILL